MTTLDAGGSWQRFYRLAFSSRYFDASDSHRFNAPSGEFGVLYAGADDACAFIETFGRELGTRLVSRAELGTRGRSVVTLVRELRVVDLTEHGLAVIRADGRLTTGEYRVAQRWSRAFHQHPDHPDGVIWRSRFDPSKMCLAVYERAGTSVGVTHQCKLDDPRFGGALGSILNRYQFALL